MFNKSTELLIGAILRAKHIPQVSARKMEASYGRYFGAIFFL